MNPPQAPPPRTRTNSNARSLCIGTEIDLRSLRKPRGGNIPPLTLPAGKSGQALLFRYGAVVLFDVSPEEQGPFLDQILHAVRSPEPQPMAEDIELRLPSSDPADHPGTLTVPDFSPQVQQVVAEVLARSVVLERFERGIDHAFESLQPIANRLGAGRLTRRHHAQLLQRLAGTLLDRQEMAGRIAVADKPDILWDHPELERLYARTMDEFEITGRSQNAEAKLSLIDRSLRTAIDLIQARRALRVEWYIVILILVEICLSLLRWPQGG